jgi:hypothetical protein
MTTFRAIPAPTSDDLSRVAALDPANPFAGAAWVGARALLGQQPCVLELTTDDGRQVACMGFVRAGRVRRTLEVPSLPPVDGHAADFWDGLLSHIDKAGLDVLEVNSFGSTQAYIPDIRGEQGRRNRLEHVLDLQEGDLFARLSTHHRRQVRKARKAGVQVSDASGEPALAAHVAAVNASMRRRAGRGEDVEPDADDPLYAALVKSGAATLHQAFATDGAMLSSILVLRAAEGAYLQSSGSTTDGMHVGASHLLFHDLTCALRAAGLRLFNFGGAAEDNPGLLEFKEAFGTRRVPLASAEFHVGHGLRYRVSLVAHAVRASLSDVVGRRV